ncbi:CDGSH iron-sulfur domain-containing protein 2 homolog B [Octopus bimaculoides]|nr:CDGSH iron-sulfur domain-containing protein 2 homolog B [Octopus bimaculoides]
MPVMFKGDVGSCTTVKDWLSLMPFVGTVSLIVYVTSHTFQEKWEQYQGRNRDNLCKVNLSIKKCSDKVVDMVDIEDLGDKVVYCRCWRSATFPFCDGSHAKHNKLTSDNVGPLVLKRRESGQ